MFFSKVSAYISGFNCTPAYSLQRQSLAVSRHEVEHGTSPNAGLIVALTFSVVVEGGLLCFSSPLEI